MKKALLLSTILALSTVQTYAQAPEAQAPAAQAPGALNGQCEAGPVISGRMTMSKDKSRAFLDAFISNPAAPGGRCTIRFRIEGAQKDVLLWETEPFNKDNEDITDTIQGGSFSVSPDNQSANLSVTTSTGDTYNFPNIPAPN